MKPKHPVGMMALVLFLAAGMLQPSLSMALRMKTGPSDASSQGPSQTTSVDGVAECSGIVQPARQFSIVLEPGERVVQCNRDTGERVAAGDILLTLANDALSARHLLLVEKRLNLKREQDGIAVLKTKMNMIAAAIDDLTQQISKERQIKDKIPDYLIEGRLGGWLADKRQKEDELKLIRQQIDQFSSRKGYYETLVRHTDESIVSIEDRLAQLDVKAPFDGRLAVVNCEQGRLAPGQLILILHDDQNLKVDAKAWQSQLPYIEPGCRVKVFPNFYKQDFFWGTVLSIGSAKQAEDTRYPVFPVVVDLEAPPANLRVGMAVSVQIMSIQGKK